MYQTTLPVLMGVCALVCTAAPTRLPVVFEENKGQAPASVRFISAAGTHALWLKDRGAVLRTPSGRMQIEMRNARPVNPVAGKSLPGFTNYFMGSDRTKWRSAIRHFEDVRYSGIYPGIDFYDAQ